MRNQITGPVEGLVLCPVEDGTDGRSFVLLPTLAELLHRPGFAMREPICLPGHPRPLDGWTLFGNVRGRAIPLH